MHLEAKHWSDLPKQSLLELGERGLGDTGYQKYGEKVTQMWRHEVQVMGKVCNRGGFRLRTGYFGNECYSWIAAIE